MSNEATLDAVVAALDVGGTDETVVTSVRVPAALRDAAKALQALGAGPSFNEVLVQGARDRVEALAHRAGLDRHYGAYPELRPSLGSVALALARLDASELADRADLIDQAAAELAATRPTAGADDVLTYAAALLAHEPV